MVGHGWAEGLEKGDQLALFDFVELERNHFGRLVGDGQPQISAAAAVVKIDNFFQGGKDAIVHIGCAVGQVAQRRDAELAPVGRVAGGGFTSNVAVDLCTGGVGRHAQRLVEWRAIGGITHCCHRDQMVTLGAVGLAGKENQPGIFIGGQRTLAVAIPVIGGAQFHERAHIAGQRFAHMRRRHAIGPAGGKVLLVGRNGLQFRHQCR